MRLFATCILVFVYEQQTKAENINNLPSRGGGVNTRRPPSVTLAYSVRVELGALVMGTCKLVTGGRIARGHSASRAGAAQS